MKRLLVFAALALIGYSRPALESLGIGDFVVGLEPGQDLSAVFALIAAIGAVGAILTLSSILAEGRSEFWIAREQHHKTKALEANAGTTKDRWLARADEANDRGFVLQFVSQAYSILSLIVSVILLLWFGSSMNRREFNALSTSESHYGATHEVR